MYKRTRVASLMDLSKITSVLCNVTRVASLMDLSKITSVLCNVQEDKSSWSHGPVKDNKCAMQCTRGQE